MESKFEQTNNEVNQINFNNSKVISKIIVIKNDKEYFYEQKW